MQIAAILMLASIYLIGFAAIFFTSVGTLIILLGVLIFSMITGFKVISLQALAIMLGLYLIGEILEFFLGFWGARRFGASNRAAWAGMLGGLMGAGIGSFFLGVGAFLGTIIGIFAGVLIVEKASKKGWKQALTAGTGGILGRLGAIVMKVMIALIMGGILIYEMAQQVSFSPFRLGAVFLDSPVLLC